MRNPLYYGEMVAHISGRVHQNSDHITRINQLINKENDQDDTICTLCADAGKVFDTIENLSGDHFLDWHNALELYCRKIIAHFLKGKKPNMIDMLSMAIGSVEATMQASENGATHE